MLQNQREILHALLSSKEKIAVNRIFNFLLVEKILQNVLFLLEFTFKVKESLLISQDEFITACMTEYLSPHLCGYRKGFSTQTALSSLIEKWKQILDSKGYGAAVLMDLSKAFDTINHELLIAKLHAYGFTKKSLTVIFNNLSDRWQHVKIDSSSFFALKDVEVCNFADVNNSICL